MRTHHVQAAALLALMLQLPVNAQTTPAADPQLARGKRLFLRCVACHDVADTTIVKVGPNLRIGLAR